MISGGNCAAAPVKPPNKTAPTTLATILLMVFLPSFILAFDRRRLTPRRFAKSQFVVGIIRVVPLVLTVEWIEYTP